MLRNVYLKTLRDRRRLLLWWSVGVIAYMGILAASYPAVADQREELQELIDQYPQELLALFGVSPEVDLFSPAGYVDSQATALIVPLAFAILAAAMGARAIAGEEEANTIDILLANPISRREVLLQKFASMVTAVGLLAVALMVGIGLGGLFEMDIPLGNVAAVSVSAALLALLFGAVALAAGAVTGRRGVSLAVVSLLAVASFLLDALGEVLEGLSTLRTVSPFYLYDAARPLVSGLDLGHAGLLALVTLAAVVVAVWGFERRDVGV
jgi:ABC-2 type transport system permease protein